MILKKFWLIARYVEMVSRIIFRMEVLMMTLSPESTISGHSSLWGEAISGYKCECAVS